MALLAIFHTSHSRLDFNKVNRVNPYYFKKVQKTENEASILRDSSFLSHFHKFLVLEKWPRRKFISSGGAFAGGWSRSSTTTTMTTPTNTPITTNTFTIPSTSPSTPWQQHDLSPWMTACCAAAAAAAALPPPPPLLRE
jgi:hypothetical protein